MNTKTKLYALRKAVTNEIYPIFYKNKEDAEYMSSLKDVQYFVEDIQVEVISGGRCVLGDKVYQVTYDISAVVLGNISDKITDFEFKYFENHFSE